MVVFNSSDGSQKAIMKCVDAVMYETRDAGRNRVRYHDTQI